MTHAIATTVFGAAMLALALSPAAADPPATAPEGPTPQVLLVPAPPMALPADPQPWPAATILPAVVPNWLPPADPLDQPRVLPAESARPLKSRPVEDVPPLVSLPAPAALPTLPAWPLACAFAPDVGDLLTLGRRVRPNQGRANPGVDETMELSLRALLATWAKHRAMPAPFIKLTIPQPVESPDAMPVRVALPDTDAPVLLPPALPREKMPTK